MSDTDPQFLDTSGGQFPLHQYRFQHGDREWSVLHTGAVLTEDDEADAVTPKATRVPYGVALWPSAIALSLEVATRSGTFAGRSVLELGAGTGLPGIVAAALGGRVVQTDRNELTLQLCRRNGERNRVAIDYRLADWTSWEETGKYDWILGADVLYGEALHPQLRRIFAANLRAGGRILLADPFRSMSLRLLEAMEADRWGVTCSRWDVGEGRRIGVFELTPPDDPRHAPGNDLTSPGTDPAGSP